VGTIRPRIESDLGFRIAGKVARRLIEVGAAVKPGDALALLDETDLRLQYEQAEAELRAARSSLDQASAEEERAADLRRRGWSTEAAFDRQKAIAAEARGRVARAEKAVALAQNALGYATLRADAEGVVTATLIEPGQVVAPGQPAVRLARTAELEVVVAIPETLVAQVRDGTASVSLWSQAGRVLAATLREMSPAADPVSRTYQARFSLPDAGDAVRIGMTATVSVATAQGGRAARLPLSALFDQGGGPSVWVVDPATGALSLRPVTVVRYEARDVLVSGGIADGDQVVALGVQKLDAAQKVRVVRQLGS
jgi:RND family efflux transporter MFP subunit